MLNYIRSQELAAFLMSKKEKRIESAVHSEVVVDEHLFEDAASISAVYRTITDPFFLNKFSKKSAR